jgi:hypothetical protein
MMRFLGESLPLAHFSISFRSPLAAQDRAGGPAAKHLPPARRNQSHCSRSPFPCRACTLSSYWRCLPQSLLQRPRPLVSASMLDRFHRDEIVHSDNYFSCFCGPPLFRPIVVSRGAQRRAVPGSDGCHARRDQVLCADRCQCVRWHLFLPIVAAPRILISLCFA